MNIFSYSADALAIMGLVPLFMGYIVVLLISIYKVGEADALAEELERQEDELHSCEEEI